MAYIQSDMTLNKEENMEDKELLQDEVLDEQVDKDDVEDKQEDPKVEDKEKQPEEKKFSQKDLDKIVQQRLDREMKKFKQELSEAERLAKMSEEERAKLEMDKLKAEFEAEKTKFQKEKLELEATKILGKEGLPVDFAPLLLGEDADSTHKNITAFKSAFQGAVEKAVEEKLKGGYKPKKADGVISGVTVDQFKAMSLVERQDLAEKDPELYNKLKTQAKQG